MIIDNQFQLYGAVNPLGQLARRHFPTLNKPSIQARLELAPLLVYDGAAMMNISVQEAQANLPALLQKASEGEEIVISQADTPIAKIVAVTSARRTRLGLGLDVGKGWVADDFDAPLPDDLQAYFEGCEP